MTKASQKSSEQESLAEFLSCWTEGRQWALVPEPQDAEAPDVLLHRVDGAEVVGLELTRYVLAPLAQAHVVAREIADEVQRALQEANVRNLGVFLSFYEASALAIGPHGKERRARIARIAEFIIAKGSVGAWLALDRRELEVAGIDSVAHVGLFASDELSVTNAGTSGHGLGAQVLQQPIDEKLRKLPAYRSATSARAARVAPTARVGGVWLLVTVFEGKGISSSILTTDAERCVRRREFDRVFLLDRWERGDRRVIEIREA